MSKDKGPFTPTLSRPGILDPIDGFPMCAVSDNCEACPLERCILEGPDAVAEWRRLQVRQKYEAELARLGKSQAAVKAVAEQEGVTPRAVWRRLGLRE